MLCSGTKNNVIPSGFIKRRSKLTDETGSVLATVLVTLMILLAVFISAMTYALSRYSHHVQYHNRLVASHLAEAGIAYRRATLDTHGITLDTTHQTTPNGGTITTITQPWGPYLLIESAGSFANQTAREFAIVGSEPPGYMDGAVTAFDPVTPLVVAGNTRIIGDVFTGPLGIMTGRFRGVDVTHDDYLHGVNHKDAVISPFKPDSSVTMAYTRLAADRKLQTSNQIAGSLVLGPADRDPFEDMRAIRIRNDLLMSNARLRPPVENKSMFVDGHAEISGTSHVPDLIEIVSDEFIVVRDSAVVDGALLFAADSVILEGNAVFSGIVVCGGRVIVREQARLLYPSALINFAVPGTGKPIDSAGIYLQIKGYAETVAVVERSDEDSRNNRVLYVDTATSVRGYLYSGEHVDLRGTVYGSVVTEQFRFEYPPTTYINWLTNCCIDRTKLDYHPCLPILKRSDSLVSTVIVSIIGGQR